MASSKFAKYVICTSCNKRSMRVYHEEIAFGTCKCGGQFKRVPGYLSKKLEKAHEEMKCQQ
jgi:hypothetical protein